VRTVRSPHGIQWYALDGGGHSPQCLSTACETTPAGAPRHAARSMVFSKDGSMFAFCDGLALVRTTTFTKTDQYSELTSSTVIHCAHCTNCQSREHSLCSSHPTSKCSPHGNRMCVSKILVAGYPHHVHICSVYGATNPENKLPDPNLRLWNVHTGELIQISIQKKQNGWWATSFFEHFSYISSVFLQNGNHSGLTTVRFVLASAVVKYNFVPNILSVCFCFTHL
jgi:hypothetical protein